MKDKKLLKDFIKYSSLNVLGMMSLSMYILADTFFISKALGANGLAALNLAIPFYSFIHGGGLMIGMGGATKYSIYKSQKCSDESNKIFTESFVMTIFVSILYFIIGLFFSNQIISFFDVSQSVFEMSKTYLQVILIFAPMFMMNNLLLCFVRNDGAPHLSMAAMIIGSFSNIILDYIFMFPLNMGIFGSVLATGLAPVISLIVLSPYFIQKRNNFKLKRLTKENSESLGILSIGLPSLITEASSGVVIIVFNLLILRLEGNIGIAAYGIIANLSLVVISIYTGIAQGIQPIISINYGRKKDDNVNEILRYAMITLLIISAIIYMFIYLKAEWITNIFNNQGNEVLQSIAEEGLKYYFSGCLFAGFNIILSSYFSSIEYSRPAHIISLLRGFILIILFALLLSLLGGIIGIWLAFPFTEFLVSMLGLLIFKLHKKERNLYIHIE